jgi:hypothetical protein
MLSQERRRQRSSSGRVEGINARRAGPPPTRRSKSPSPDMFQTDGGPTLPDPLARATEKPAQIDLTDLFHESLIAKVTKSMPAELFILKNFFVCSSGNVIRLMNQQRACLLYKNQHNENFSQESS